MAKKNTEHIIFSNMNIKYEDWEEDYKDYLECNDKTEEECSIEEYVSDSLYLFFQDEHYNLNKACGTILAIAELGLWDGTHSAYHVSHKGNLKDILDIVANNSPSNSEVKIYSDGKDIKAVISHHDGTNYITFREVREGRNITKLCNKLYNQEEVTSREISACTKSLAKVVAEIYGW